jgi:hypothetical protein
MTEARDEKDLVGKVASKQAGEAHASRRSARLFEIHVNGHLSSEWSDWLEGLEVKLLENGEMILSGPIIDQAALMGVLNKLYRLNLTILSVNEVKQKKSSEKRRNWRRINHGKHT